MALASEDALSRPSASLSLVTPPPALASFVSLSDAIGDGIVEIDDSGITRALNATGRVLLPLIGGSDGGLAPVELFDALTSSREADAVVIRDFVASGRESPGTRHIRIAALAHQAGRFAALRDSTEERLLQERVLQSEKMASVGQLVSGVAHELNNPLTGVMGFAQLLLSRDLDEVTLAQVRTIYGEAERAAKIVQNLLSFARRRKPAKEMADVNALLAQVLELRSYDFAIRNIALDMELDSRMPHCWVDADQVQQVFFNIVKNAEQAMIEANRGGKLVVRSEAIGPGDGPGGVGESASGIRIMISDDGPGIPPEVQRRIFDPFFTTKEAGQGTGLGLTISYGIIDEHGGRIWAEPALSGGARFVIELPVSGPEAVSRPATPAALASTPPPGAEAPPREASGPRYRVLVVDDEESIRLLLRDILEMDGHEVALGSSGIEAWQRLEDGQFDVIITDMKMPGMDGATFYREVRRRDPGLARRIIFITGDTVSPDTRAFLQDVHNPVLSKPFKIGPLREAMQAIVAAAAV
jgi:two-component system NtrC family sensor kinase